MLERKLEELTTENLLFEHEIERLKLLQKKKAWLEFDAQNDHVKSLNEASELLKDQNHQAQQRLQSLENKIASVGTETPLGQVQ